MTHRVALGFAVLSVLLVTACGVHLYQALKLEMSQRDQEELAGKIALFQKTLTFVPDTATLRETPGVLTHFLIGHDNLALRVRNAAGDIIVDSRAPLPTLAWHGLMPGAKALGGTGSDGQPWQGLTATGQLAGGQRVQLEAWRNTHAQEALLQWYRNQILLANLLAALIAAALGWLLVRRSLTPLRALTASAQDIHHHTLNRRLDTAKVPEELQGLVESFNGVLEHLTQHVAWRRVARRTVVHDCPLRGLIAGAGIFSSRLDCLANQSMLN